MVSSLTPYDLPFPQNGGSICPQYTWMTISLQRVIRSTSCLVLGWGLGDGGSNGAIYASNKSKMAAAAMLEKFQMVLSPQPVVQSTSMFCSRVGFSGTADLMALFAVRTNPRWRPPPSWTNFKWPYIRNSSRSTYIAPISRGHLCDSTAFLFLLYLLFFIFSSNFVDSKSFVTMCNLFPIRKLDTWRHRAHDHSTHHRPLGLPTYRRSIVTKSLSPAISRYWHLSVLGSRPWPFMFTWRHRSRDNSIPRCHFL